MYYLQSRYYDPDTGRFINADDVDFIGVTGTIPSHNLFAYCENNPVNLVDATGCYAWYDFYRARWFVSGAINLAISLIVGGAVSAVSKTLEKFIKKMGRRAAANYITHTLRTKLLKAGLKAMIANKIVKSIGAIFAVISAFFDIGGFIFDWIDAHDKRPNSGYIDW